MVRESAASIAYVLDFNERKYSPRPLYRAGDMGVKLAGTPECLGGYFCHQYSLLKKSWDWVSA